MRKLVVRLKVGDAYEAEADAVTISHTFPTHILLNVSREHEIIAQFFADSVVGYWWVDGPEVIK